MKPLLEERGCDSSEDPVATSLVNNLKRWTCLYVIETKLFLLGGIIAAIVAFSFRRVCVQSPR